MNRYYTYNNRHLPEPGFHDPEREGYDMRIRKLLPVLCMALGLTMAAPLAAGATGNTDAGTVSGTTQDTQTTNATGWHKNDEDGSRMTTLLIGKIVTGLPSGLQTVRDEKKSLLLQPGHWSIASVKSRRPH